MTQNVRGRLFQLSCQILEFLAACDVSLQLRKRSQVVGSTLPYLLHRSLRDPLGDSWGGRLPLPGDIDPDQKPLTFLFTANGRQPCWATNGIEIPTQQTLCIRMEWDTTSLACLTTPDRDRPTPHVKVTELYVADLLHTQPRIDEQGQQGFITRTEDGVLLSASRTQQRINSFSRKGSWSQRFCRNVLHVCHGVLNQKMRSERPATIPSERGQSAVNGGRSSPIITLAGSSPVTEVFMP
jgi:hypothetical protein